LRAFLINCTAAAALAVSAPFAFAADMYPQAPVLKAPPVAAIDPWTGFYIGATVGYGWGSGDSSILPNAPEIGIGAGDPVFGPLPSRPDYNGFVGGGQVGYNARFNNWIAGLETDVSYAGLHGTNNATGALFIGGTFSTTLERRLDWFGTLRGRLGFLATNDLLIYGTAGLAYGDAVTKMTATNLSAACPFNWCLSSSTSGVSVGWAAGAGVEYAFAPQWTAKAEYLHVDLGSRSVTAVDSFTVGGAVTTTSTTRVDIARVGVNFHFLH
jgi:outer membrane immunogenic protein